MLDELKPDSLIIAANGETFRVSKTLAAAFQPGDLVIPNPQHGLLHLSSTERQIVDQKRINEILQNIRKKSVLHGVDPKITSRIWKTMIWSFVNFQRRNFKKK